MPIVCYCDRCGESPADFDPDDGELPQVRCECGAFDWVVNEVHPSEVEGFCCPHCGEPLE